jgi:hypothetical protein
VLRRGKLIFDGAPAELGTGEAFENAIHELLTDEAHRVSLSERIDVLPHQPPPGPTP